MRPLETVGDCGRLLKTVGDYIVIKALQIAGYYVIHIASHCLRHLDPPYMCHYPRDRWRTAVQKGRSEALNQGPGPSSFGTVQAQCFVS